MQLYHLVQGALESHHTPEDRDVPHLGNVSVWYAEEREWHVVFRFGDGEPVIWRHTTEELVWLFRYYMLALNDDVELVTPIDFACAPRGDMAQFVVGMHPKRSGMGNNGWWAFEYFRVWVLQGKADWSDMTKEAFVQYSRLHAARAINKFVETHDCYDQQISGSRFDLGPDYGALQVTPAIRGPSTLALRRDYEARVRVAATVEEMIDLHAAFAIQASALVKLPQAAPDDPMGGEAALETPVLLPKGKGGPSPFVAQAAAAAAAAAAADEQDTHNKAPPAEALSLIHI